MKRANGFAPNGFAMTEALVAIGIGALIMTAMIYLQVDFIGWTRRAAALGRPDPSDRAIQAALRDADRCVGPGRVLAVDNAGGVGLKGEKEVIPFLSLPEGGRADIVTARKVDGSERPGWSAATVARGDTVIAVAALRCDLPEVCIYDPDRGDCGKR